MLIKVFGMLVYACKGKQLVKSWDIFFGKCAGNRYF